MGQIQRRILFSCRNLYEKMAAAYRFICEALGLAPENERRSCTLAQRLHHLGQDCSWTAGALPAKQPTLSRGGGADRNTVVHRRSEFLHRAGTTKDVLTMRGQPARLPIQRVCMRRDQHQLVDSEIAHAPRGR